MILSTSDPGLRTIGRAVEMLERYRTLGAVLALGEFSVAELASLSEVQESTVRTILRRERLYVEQIGTEPTGRRGGQPVRWRMRAEARERLRLQLQELERLGAGPWLGERQDASYALPAGIIAAEDVLLHGAPAAADPIERADLIKLARAHIDAADAAGSVVPEGAGQRVALHHRIVKLLLDLEEIELLRGPSLLDLPERVRGIFMDLLLAAGEADDELLTDAIRKRLELIPFSLLGDPAVMPHPAFGEPADSGSGQFADRHTALPPGAPRSSLVRLSGSFTDNETVGSAAALISLGVDLDGLGRHQEALAATEEAVSMWRSLAGSDPDHQHGLAAALTNLGAVLDGLGRHQEALAATEEAVSMWRSLAGSDSDHQRGLAAALTNLGAVLDGLGRHQEALAATEEAVSMWRSLAGSDPDQPDVSRSEPVHEVPCTEVLDRVYSYLDGELEAMDYAKIREHLDECGPCLREYGLEEAVKRVVQKHCGSDAEPAGIRGEVLARIRQVRAEIEPAPERASWYV